MPWWRVQMKTFSALLALSGWNPPVTRGSPSQRPVTRSFDISFDVRSNKRLRKQSEHWWFETPSRSLWRHCNDWGRHGSHTSIGFPIMQWLRQRQPSKFVHGLPVPVVCLLSIPFKPVHEVTVSWRLRGFPTKYCQISNIRCTVVGNTFVDNSDVVGASHVGAATTTSSLSTENLASIDCTKPTARRDKKVLSFGIWCGLY